ncbi:uncharacterized protein LOC113502344 [Trichoplusia ni]|uniref:Uncharacterized protein LOC113502344 n=1 Tax=Trichoplusia ni TaxID=7111 RepID=A0A7E5WG60_TRINI|nr:uncharacterized protein LOC113502344 [Trichoplusia ni]
MSPKKKKPKLAAQNTKNLKRESDTEDLSVKRAKVAKTEEDELKAKKKKNFIEACKQVTSRAYFDLNTRLLLLYSPSCLKTARCKHEEKAANFKQMPPYAAESFMIEMKNNAWSEGLEVCQMCITPNQYLSANVLMGVVEIMLNAHDDDFCEHSVPDIIDKCQQILSQNFSTHPPCIDKPLRACYNKFLTSPMDLKEKTFTNRTEYECSKGIVKYCINRLEYEISNNSIDGPLVDKNENIPMEMQQSVRGMHWQKERFEIFELLDRHERIERLMAVLESVIELLQFDLAIWNSRYTSGNVCRHLMRSHKPLMAFVLWGDCVLLTGAVTTTCRQILRLFAYMVHLEYPDSMLRTMTVWLNIMVQTFYICETDSNMNYPNVAKYSTVLGREFYKMISDMPHSSIIRIIETIEPSYMKHILGVTHAQRLLLTDNDCIINILIQFINNSQWEKYPKDNNQIILSERLFPKPKKIKKVLNYLIKKCTSWTLESTSENREYGKINLELLQNESEPSINHVIHTLYITLEAYIDTYDIHSVKETWDKLNEQALNHSSSQNKQEYGSYAVTEHIIKKYKSILKNINELHLAFQNLKSVGVPEALRIFENAGLL